MQAPKQGSALLTALFIMTLVAIVATAMTSRLQLDIYRTQLIITQDKLYLASQAVTFWALAELNDPKNRFTKLLKEGTVANYPSTMQKLQTNFQVSGGLYDLQAQFNLNNLRERKSLLQFVNLMDKALSKSNHTDNMQMAMAVLNWISDFDPALGKDSFTSYYLAQNPAYYPSHQLMQSQSEFRLIKNVSAQTYLALEPFITALPETTPINLNTASKEVLMSLGNGLTEEKVSMLLSAREGEEIKDMKSITNLLSTLDLPSQQVTIDSRFFLSAAQITFDGRSMRVYALLQRKVDKNGKLTVSLLRESINGF